MSTQDIAIRLNVSFGDLIALWGGITGTIGLIISHRNYKRDRADIVVEVKKDMNIINSPTYDPKEIYTCLTILNKGRRPVTISKTGYVYLTKIGGAILSDSMIYGSREVVEGKSTDYLIRQKDVKFNDINYFAAYDAIGNTYKKYYAPPLKRFWYWFLHITYLRRKPLITEKKK